MNAQHEDNDGMAMVPYAPQQLGVVRPIVRPDDMVVAIREYEALKAAIIQKKDVQKIGPKQHIKKSGWLRIARAFGVSCFAVSSQYVVDADGGDWGYEVVVRAVAPNGAEMQGDGACYASEKTSNLKTRHNVRAHAFTRATNRAISNLVGGGEVSAEELQDFRDSDDDDMPAPAQAPRPQQQRPAPTPVVSRPTANKGASDLRILGNKLGWSVAEYETEFRRLCGERGPYTDDDRVRWEKHLRDLLAKKEQAEAAVKKAQTPRRRVVNEETGEVIEPAVEDETLTPDEEAPFSLRGDAVPQGA